MNSVSGSVPPELLEAPADYACPLIVADGPAIQNVVLASLRSISGRRFYVVDDMPQLTWLYAALLESRGGLVETFNDRGDALAALSAEIRKPDLLITDCLGGALPIQTFLGRCADLHPDMPILMASGLCPSGLGRWRVRPNYFIRKPFSLEEFARAVDVALAGR